MPEIFIDEEPSSTVDEAELARRQAEDLDAIAAWAEWLAAQSETIQALAREWMELRGSRFETSQRHDKRGRVVYVCKSDHGYHESLQSFEHAVFLMVDAHRTREEDKASTVEALKQRHGSTRNAVKVAQQLAQDLRARHPKARGEEWDALYREALKGRDA